MNEVSTAMMAGMALHFVSCLLIFIAIVSAIVWLVRFATKAELKKAFWTSLVFGVILCIASCLIAGPVMMKDWDREGDREDMEERMDEMMQSTPETPTDAMDATTEVTETVAE